jgi:serine protease
MRRVLPALLLIAAAGTAPAARAATTGRVEVLLRPGARAADSLTTAGVRFAGPRAPAIGLVTVRPLAGETVPAAVARLHALPGVAAAAAEHRFALRDAPDDPALTRVETASGTEPGTTLQWWPAREGFPVAWSYTHGAGARVGVIDTGVDGTHPELRGKVVVAIDRDDIPGDGPATTDEEGHGTHVASLACANTDNGVGIAGAGWRCRLVIVKSDLTDASVATAIVDATHHHVQALNMSFGDDPGTQASPAIARALRYAVSRGVVLVAAAADEPTMGDQGDPANTLQPAGTGHNLARGEGLTVTAADYQGARSSFAGGGSEISLAAYGAYEPARCGDLVPQSCGPPGLLGAFPLHARMAGPSGCGCETTLDGDPRYAYLQGTSMAAPQVSAAAALVRTLNPDLGALAVVRLLKRTARRAGGWTLDLGWGILDAGAAVAAAAQMDRRPPVTRIHGPRRGRAHHVLGLRWSGRDRAPARVRRAGIADVDLYAAVRGHRPRRVERVRRGHRLAFRPARPGVYVLYTLATDRQGNRERRPRTRLGVRVV